MRTSRSYGSSRAHGCIPPFHGSPGRSGISPSDTVRAASFGRHSKSGLSSALMSALNCASPTLPARFSFEHRARHRSILALHVLPERRRDPARIAPLVGEPHRQIEQVPALAPLIECSQLCRQQLVELEGRDIRPPRVPPRPDREGASREAKLNARGVFEGNWGDPARTG